MNVATRPTFRVGDRVWVPESGTYVFGHVTDILGAYLVVRGPDGWPRRVAARFVRSAEDGPKPDNDVQGAGPEASTEDGLDDDESLVAWLTSEIRRRAQR